jgi:hypothetical protein
MGQPPYPFSCDRIDIRACADYVIVNVLSPLTSSIVLLSIEWNVCQAATVPLDRLPAEIVGGAREEKNRQNLQ